VTKVNYRWRSHGTSGGIYETTEAAGSAPQVLSTFGEARAALGGHFRAMEAEAGYARYRARNLRKGGAENGEWSA
jgi:hypothetical protein